MKTDTVDCPEFLIEEMRNFKEIASCLSPAPGELPRISGIDVCGFSMPLREIIGGDHILYLDFARRYDLDRRVAEAQRSGRRHVAQRLHNLKSRAGVLVADVSGHRMTDALVAAMLHQAFLLGVYYELDMFGEITTRLFEHINTRFYKTTQVNKYFTMIYGEISRHGSFRFISAGHLPPAVFSREYGRFVPIRSVRTVSGPPVGLLPSGTDPDDGRKRPRADVKRLEELNQFDLLAVGDILMLYTDGLSDHAGGDFFPDRVESLLAQHANANSSAICAVLQEELRLAGDAEDDISVVVIKKTA